MRKYWVHLGGTSTVMAEDDVLALLSVKEGPASPEPTEWRNRAERRSLQRAWLKSERKRTKVRRRLRKTAARGDSWVTEFRPSRPEEPDS